MFLPDVKEPHFYAFFAEPSTAAHLYPDAAKARQQYEAVAFRPHPPVDEGLNRLET